MKKNIAVLGECMVELYQGKEDVKLGFGGDTLNTAIYIARLMDLNKFVVNYVTAVGKNQLSQQMVDTWRNEGIDTTYVDTLEDKDPGLYLINVDDMGERSFTYWRNDSAAKYWLERISDQSYSELILAKYIYLSGISLAVLPKRDRKKLIHLLAEVKKHGGKIVFDNNYRPALWENVLEVTMFYKEVLKLTDIALLTFEDEQLIYGDVEPEESIKRTLAFGVKEIVIKQGHKDCLVITPNKHYVVPALQISSEKVIDTTAAGDSFAAGYIASRLSGNSAEIAARQGHKLASTVIQHPGAIIDKSLMDKCV